MSLLTQEAKESTDAWVTLLSYPNPLKYRSNFFNLSNFDIPSKSLLTPSSVIFYELYAQDLKFKESSWSYFLSDNKLVIFSKVSSEIY